MGEKATGLLTKIPIIPRLILGVVFVLIPIMAFLCYTSWGIIAQYSEDIKYKPVPAKVLSADISEHTVIDKTIETGNAEFTVYEPVVSYQYELNGQKYTGNNIFPLYRGPAVKSIRNGFGPIREKSDLNWAEKIIEPLKKAETVTAYVHPDDPTIAFLVWHYRYIPYLMMQCLIIFISVILFIVLSGDRHIKIAKKPRLVFQSGMKRYKIKSSISFLRYIFICTLILIWTGILLCPSLHYFSVSTPPHEIKAYVAIAVVSLVAFVLLIVIIAFAVHVVYFKEARFFANTDTFYLGSTIETYFSQKVRKKIKVSEAMIKLVAEEVKETDEDSDKDYEFKECCADEHIAAKEQRVATYEPFEFEWTTTIPLIGAPSSLPNTKKFPKCNWFFEVFVKYGNNMDYRRKYPIFVKEEKVKMKSR